MTAQLRLQIRSYVPNREQRSHSHDALHLSLILQGGVAETVGRTTEYAGALAIVAKDAGVVHTDHFGRSGARVAQLSLAGGTLSSLAETASCTDGWRWTQDPSVARPYLRLVNRSRQTDAVFDVTDGDVLDLLAAFTARRAAEPKGNPPIWLADVVAHIRGGWHAQMTGATAAAFAGVHPVYLARCVRRWYSIGLADMVRAARRRAAIGAVTDSDHRLAAVAYDGGYADEPHLCRDVRNTVGVSPGQLRSLIRSV